MKYNILIFTKKVLPRSNTFVAAQTKGLKQFIPTFIGFRKDKTGLSLIGESDTCTLQEHTKYLNISKFALEVFYYVPKRWKHALQAKKPSIIHAHFGKGGFYCVNIANSLDIPLVVTFHGSDITQNDKFSYNTKHRKLVFDNAKIIIAVSKFIETKLLENHCPKEKIIQLYTGIDCTFFSTKQENNDIPTVLFVGRLIKQKGVDYLLKAMQLVEKKLPQAQVIIAGDGVQRKYLEELGRLNKNIKFVGSQSREQIRDLMDNAWILCAPSIRMTRGNEEGLGMVFLEAQAMGTPIISFDTGGIKEAVIDGKTGLLVKEGDINTLSEKIELLLTDTELRNKFSYAGIKHVREHFNINHQNKVLENLYLQTIKGYQ
ncbi:glycosyltransferase [Colwellia echini]|uniref:Glycosyltransferase n=1 Tax=Colwellia echini TaxID=1982103 RepID=A0ABY3N1X3_9GAMM|nr:glycosyltransferase [Colwellia echini]TYK67409.1 glycosyltransferase [Colwellia echini]